MSDDTVRIYLIDHSSEAVYEVGLSPKLTMDENKCLLRKMIYLPDDAIFIIHRDGYVIDAQEILSQIGLKEGDEIDVY